MRLTNSENARFRLLPATDNEAAVLSAAVEGRQGAVERLEDQFRGLDVDSICMDPSANRAALVEVEHLNELRTLASEFDQLIGRAPAVGPRMRASKGEVADPPMLLASLGQTTRGGQPVLDPVLTTLELKQGVTVTLNDVVQDVPSVRALCNDIQRAFASAVQLNVYMSEADAPGFGRHWDDHDVIILQVQGSKLWEVFEPGALHASKGVVPREAAGDSVWTGVLDPGFALFIPRGWPHSVKGFVDSTCVHFTIGIKRTILSDILAELYVPEDASWRVDAEVVASAVAKRRLAVHPYRSGGVLSAASTLAGEGSVSMALPSGAIFVQEGTGTSSSSCLAGPNGAVAFTNDDVQLLTHLAGGSVAYSERYPSPDGPTVSDGDLAVLSAAGLVQFQSLV